MSRTITIQDFEQAGFDAVTPQAMFGRNSTLMSGEPIYEGGYRAVSPNEIFGEGNFLVEPEAVTMLQSSFVDTFVYALLVFVAFALYLNMLLHSWGFIGAIWGNLFSMHSERRMASEGGELPLSYFKVVAIIVGILMIALVGVRIADMGIAANSSAYSSIIDALIPVMALMLVLVFAAWLYVLRIISGWITLSPAVDELSSISQINFVRYVVLMFPLVGAWLVAPVDALRGWSIALVSGSAILLLIYLKDTFVFFIAKKIPILYWILYLCIAFLLPTSFIIRMLQN